MNDNAMHMDDLHEIQAAIRVVYPNAMHIADCFDAMAGGVWFDEQTGTAWIAVPSLDEDKQYDLLETTERDVAAMYQFQMAIN